PGGRRAAEPGDLRAAPPGRRHGPQLPLVGHPQAERPQPHRGIRHRPSAGPALTRRGWFGHPPRLAGMNRLKNILFVATVVGAVVAFLRNRLTEPAAVDRGGWKPVEPPR